MGLGDTVWLVAVSLAYPRPKSGALTREPPLLPVPAEAGVCKRGARTSSPPRGLPMWPPCRLLGRWDSVPGIGKQAHRSYAVSQ